MYFNHGPFHHKAYSLADEANINQQLHKQICHQVQWGYVCFKTSSQKRLT